GSPDERCWYCFAGGGPSPYQLTAVRIPAEQTRQASAGLELGDQVTFRPGVPVSVSVNITVGGVDAAAAERTIANRLQATGVPVDPSAELRVTYSANEQATGENVTYEDFGGASRDRKTHNVATRQIQVTVRLAYTNGTEVWTRESRVTHWPRSFVRGNPQQEYDQGLRSAFSSRLNSFRLPKFLFLPPDQLGAGRSALGPSGESPL
ncbi:MAG: hypothetical protein ACYSWU_07015, partial [Planctomycetota bacterium]